ncbi:DCN1-like protein 5 [Coemansia sp. RSA 2050]|nr:DCN1-like protein 5 [Coemansia sp. RSA 2050]
MATQSSREAWFSQYQDLDRDDGKQLIGPDGFVRLCEALKYSMDGLEPLVLLWKLGAKELGTVELESWDREVRAMGVTDNAALKSAVDVVVDKFKTDLALCKDFAAYKDFYRQVFLYLRSQNQRILVETAKTALPLITNQHWLFMRFVEFLEAQGPKMTTMTRDQWNLLLDLSRSVDAKFSGYSKEEAWPSLFDDFYDWIREHPAPSPPRSIDVTARCK